MRKLFSDEEKELILSKSLRKCAHCGKKISVSNMTIEHIYPVNKGGDNNNYNLVALCNECNEAKSNFIYDMSYYPYLTKKESLNSERLLLQNIYNNVSDSHIFGKLNRTIYVMDYRYADILKRRNKTNMNALKFLLKPIELREILPGDVDDDILELIGSQYRNIDEPDKKLVANKYAIINCIKDGTFYGVYFRDKLLAVFGYININQVDVDDKDFLVELDKLKYDNTYIEIIRAYKNKDEYLAMNMNEKIAEFMACTNNLVLMSSNNNDRLEIIQNNLNNRKSTYFKLPANYDYIEGLSYTITLHDDSFNTLEDLVNNVKSKLQEDKNENRIR